MAKFVVTGGAGFIGSNIAERLVKLGHSLKILDNFSSGSMKNLNTFVNEVEVIEGNIRDCHILNETFKGADYVYHEAAAPSVQQSIEDPVFTEETNVIGTINVLNAARDCGVKRVIFTSSAAVYGDSPEIPKTEGMMSNPLSPYALHKLGGEYYLKMYNRLYGFETVSLRCFNAFGPRQNPDSPYSGVISIFIGRILNNERPVIFGDGEQTRDFVYIDNIVDANISAAFSEKVGQGEIINIAAGEQTSLNKLVETINGILCTNIISEYKEARKGDIVHSVADIGRAEELLDYSAKVRLKEGLEKLICWTRDIK